MSGPRLSLESIELENYFLKKKVQNLESHVDFWATKYAQLEDRVINLETLLAPSFLHSSGSGHHSGQNFATPHPCQSQTAAQFHYNVQVIENMIGQIHESAYREMVIECQKINSQSSSSSQRHILHLISFQLPETIQALLEVLGVRGSFIERFSQKFLKITTKYSEVKRQTINMLRDQEHEQANLNSTSPTNVYPNSTRSTNVNPNRTRPANVNCNISINSNATSTSDERNFGGVPIRSSYDTHRDDGRRNVRRFPNPAPSMHSYNRPPPPRSFYPPPPQLPFNQLTAFEAEQVWLQRDHAEMIFQGAHNARGFQRESSNASRTTTNDEAGTGHTEVTELSWY